MEWKAFWQTWAHIGLGLLVAGLLSLGVYAIYDTGYRLGAIEGHKEGYDRGFEAGRMTGWYRLTH